eukprot:6212032-Pleurochrysis_carterae.AAC.1
MSLRAFLALLARVARRVAPALCTISIVMALAFLMDFGGLSDAMGSAVVRSGGAFPLFSPLLGWVGVVLTGSDTSSNVSARRNLVVVSGQAMNETHSSMLLRLLIRLWM